MPLTTHHKRFEAFRLEQFGRYFWYAIGEILLIFAGITLALWFGNWNEERQLRELELHTLKEIVADLTVNAELIEQSIEDDGRYVEVCERFLNAVSSRRPWQDADAKDIFQCQFWTSPFINSAAYESLKSKGADLISDSKVRNAIVDLYEHVYAVLVEDTDKDFWSFQTSVLNPGFIRYLRWVEPDQFVPSDYEALLDSDEFMNLMRWKIGKQRRSILDQQATLAVTKNVIGIIDAALLLQTP